jgi:hypothetical protein
MASAATAAPSIQNMVLPPTSMSYCAQSQLAVIANAEHRQARVVTLSVTDQYSPWVAARLDAPAQVNVKGMVDLCVSMC